jgi:predicted permease
VALSLILLVGAVTFVRTLWNLRHVDTGVADDRVLTMSVEVVEAHKDPDASGAFWGRLLSDIRAIPGVRSASMSVLTPLSGRDRGSRARIRGYQPPTPQDAAVHINQVSEGYFETLGVPLLRGRMLTGNDASGGPRVALLNDTAARKFFAGRDPIGESIGFTGTDVQYRIVGVVRDTRHRSLREPPPPFVFVPLRQPKEADRRVTLTVAAANPGAESALLPSIRSLVARTDSRMLVSEVITLRSQFENTLLSERLLSSLAAAFGALAVVLAAVGLYGVLSHHIGRQRHAIGIRMALGASGSSVRFRVFRQSLLMVAAGLAFGLPFAVFAARAADSLFWEVTSRDPETYVFAIGVLALVGLVSSYLPARNASTIEPAEALRHD